MEWCNETRVCVDQKRRDHGAECGDEVDERECCYGGEEGWRDEVKVWREAKIWRSSTRGPAGGVRPRAAVLERDEEEGQDRRTGHAPSAD